MQTARSAAPCPRPLFPPPPPLRMTGGGDWSRADMSIEVRLRDGVTGPGEGVSPPTRAAELRRAIVNDAETGSSPDEGSSPEETGTKRADDGAEVEGGVFGAEKWSIAAGAALYGDRARAPPGSESPRSKASRRSFGSRSGAEFDLMSALRAGRLAELSEFAVQRQLLPATSSGTPTSRATSVL